MFFRLATTMDIFCYFLVIVILLRQSSAQEIDCTNLNEYLDSENEKRSNQINCKKLSDTNDLVREATANQQDLLVEFTCQSEGRFPDLSDSSCMRYFQCDTLNDGTFSKKSLKCPNSTYCSSTQKCSSAYICPCNETTSTVTHTSPESYETSTKTTPNLCSSSSMTDFDCTTVGRFPDFNDLTCHNYFLCSRLYNGTFIKTEYKCRNSLFDRTINKCSATFTCPCVTTTSVTPSTLTTSTATPQTASASTTHSTSTSLSMTSNSLTTTHGCTTSSKEFECTKAGRFPDLSDITCRKYFLCSKLQNGTFIKTLYECKSSSFNPLTLRCSLGFICPCMGDQTTLVTPSLGSESSSTSTTEVITPSSSVVTLEDNKTAATSPLPSSSEPSTVVGCIVSSQEFECIFEGRFADLTDFTCQKYFLCSQLHNKTFVKTEYRCPNSSTFHPSTEQCSITYICPCTISTALSTDLTISSTIESGTTKATISSEGATHFPQENSTTLTGALTSSTVVSNDSSTTTACELSSSEFQCTAKGRFPDLTDFACKKYFLCSQLRNGTFIKTEYHCPDSSTFYPSSKQCSFEYVCPCISTVITTPVSSNVSTVESVTTTSTVSSEITFTSTSSSAFPLENTTVLTTSSSLSTLTPTCNVSYDDFICTTKGRFPDLTDMTCKKYFLCSHLHNGSFIKTKYQCPNLSTFYPPSEQCSSKYICPCSTTVSTSSPNPLTSLNPSTSKTATTISSEIPTHSSTSFENTTILVTSNYSSSTIGCTVSYNEFQCTAEGRFPDFSDATCRRYFLCSRLRNGTFIKTPYTCLNSFFNPLTFQCSIRYVCPCNVDYTSVTSTISFVATSSEGFTKVPTTTADINTTPYTCVPPYGIISDFNCSSVGRFPNYSDITCRKYFLCSQLHNGTFVKTSYTCPTSSCITASIQRCSSSCKCPCTQTL